MENAAEALKMAAGVLIFIVSLSISINAFAEVRQASQAILNYNDRENYQVYVKNETITQRTVGAESIIPTIYKAYKENYKIVFTSSALDNEGLYRKNGVDIYRIDLENDVVGNDEEKEKFLKALLNGENKDDFKSQGIEFKYGSLYERINGKNFIEYLGIYNQEEVQGETGTPDANKTQKRVITYDKNNT